ncbi:bifunctional helix-turn-helix transcriptional regulator/GNAT family N-acetyltransferase [Amycolatopsis anabasis]|uniref:bifunctional helix-turn-helix transcriptional regulator/GNAT family N-acetyltransferase n=1 Tax=Amycolatopsis anabasis TaxID=1840409 RepID=UPI00131CA7ED|nr:bifunctional helix-turn-helix transcriptional regulator/GNAT family N-acetyltransferase [Amycolatopsis anabasis]
MDVAQTDLAVFRRFSRYFTRRIGVLNDQYLGQARPLGQARLLFEIGSGASLRELRSRLGLDAGYLSRMLRALEAQGMVRLRRHPADSRVRLAELTRLGHAELAEQDRRANEMAGGLLRGLTRDQRAELTSAVGTVERFLRLAAVTIDVVDPVSPEARQCLSAFAAELDERFPEGFDEDDLVRPDEISGAAGLFLLAAEEGRPVGCVGLRPLEPGVAEVRHLWVHAAARGIGLAHRLLAGVENRAAERGHRVLRLGTNSVLTEAIALYRKAGYVEIPAYDRSPHTHHWFEKRLHPGD